MPLPCPRCRRSHPDAAVYCHFDGTALRHGAAPAGQFLHPFVFPSGRRCASFDDLVAACYAEWDEARLLLADGTFTAFLSSLGRADLARSAREGQVNSDRDIGLTNFLSALPAASTVAPRLGLKPRRVCVGPLRVGERREVPLTVLNEGTGMLQGRLTVADGADWLALDETAVRAAKEQPFEMSIRAAGLTAGQSYAGKLVAVTNGGVAELPVRLDVTARPFAAAPYQGAISPHELARKMRDNPKPAVGLIHGGDVKAWFESNGWTYPIAGEPAPGLACVQQYFEELGLAKAPPIQPSLTEVRLTVARPERATVTLTVACAGRKLVYGRAETNVPWLRAVNASASGQGQAAFELEVDSAALADGRPYQGAVKVVANAGQTFIVPVRVEVTGRPADEPAAAGEAWPGWMRGAIVGALGRALLLLPADVYARLMAGDASWLSAPAADGGFLRAFALAVAWVGPLAGAAYSWRRGGGAIDVACGAVAGGVLGLVGGVTLGCVLVAGDELPRAVLRALVGGLTPSPVVATGLWALTAVGVWAAIGAAVGAFVPGQGSGTLSNENDSPTSRTVDGAR